MPEDDRSQASWAGQREALRRSPSYLNATADRLPYELLERAAEEFILDPYSSTSSKFIVVVDADALLSTIAHHCRTGWEPWMLRIGASRVSRLYAADHVYGETYRGLQKFVGGPVGLDQLRDRFETEYLPLLRWVNTNGEGIADERVSLVTDETDVPTAQLASLIAPCVVLSEDKALRRPGFAPGQWRDAAGHGVKIVQASDDHDAVGMMIVLPVAAVSGGGVRLGRALGLPWWAAVGAMGVGGYVLLRNPRRRKTLGEKLTLFLGVILEQLEIAAARELAGIRGLKPLMVEPAKPPTAKQQIATVLARSPSPLLAQEIHEELERHFKDSTPTLPEVRLLLKESPEFTQPERYRWQLGRVSGTWSGVL